MSDSLSLSTNSRVLIIGASGGIGHACAIAAGNICGMMNVTPVSRDADDLDVTSEDSIKETLSRLEGPFDLILITTGGLALNGQRPEKSLNEIQQDTLLAQFTLNAIGPALVLKHLRPLMRKDGPCVVATLSARLGSIGDNNLGGWYGYRAAKAALNQLVRTTSVEFGLTHPKAICVCVHPGTVRTALTQKFLGEQPSVSAAQSAMNILSVLSNLSPKDTGGFYDWRGTQIEW